VAAIRLLFAQVSTLRTRTQPSIRNIFQALALRAEPDFKEAKRRFEAVKEVTEKKRFAGIRRFTQYG